MSVLASFRLWTSTGCYYMPCFSPLPFKFDGFTKNGKRNIIVLPRTPFNLESIKNRIPCGNCSHCRLKRSREWAIRCMHEASLYKHLRNSCFITLTYNDANLQFVPGTKIPTLVKDDFQRFLKRLRKRYVPVCPYPKGHDLRDEWMFNNRIRYYMCGEYGDKNGRPHYHAILFNWNFDSDKYFWEKSGDYDLFRSPSLESLWCNRDGSSIGYSSVADVTFDSVAYVARYCMKKINGAAALTHYAVFDDDTGEIFGERIPEYNDMSRDGGIGLGWFNKYSSDLYNSDSAVTDKGVFGVPKYYDKRLELIDPELMYNIKEKRSQQALSLSEDRLKAMEKFKLKQISVLNRKI